MVPYNCSKAPEAYMQICTWKLCVDKLAFHHGQISLLWVDSIPNSMKKVFFFIHLFSVHVVAVLNLVTCVKCNERKTRLPNSLYFAIHDL